MSLTERLSQFYRQCFFLLLRFSECLRSLHNLLPQMLLLVPGTLHQVYKQERIHYGGFRDICSARSFYCFCQSVPSLTFASFLFCFPSSPTDSNIWEEFLHFFQGRILPLDEECSSVRASTILFVVRCRSTCCCTFKDIHSLSQNQTVTKQPKMCLSLSVDSC